jgi:hypothetical protein
MSAPDQSVAAPAAAATVAPGQSITPTPNPNAESLLRQVDSFNSKLEETQKEKALALARAEELSNRNREMEARLARHAKAYEVKAEPMYQEYIKSFEANLAAEGRPPLDEATKKQYRQAFVDPDLEERRAELWANHQQTVKLAASRKQLEDRLQQQEAEQTRLKDEVAKANQRLSSGTRSSYAEAIQADNETIEVTASGRARGPGASAHALSAGEIMVAQASVSELPFLKKAGFSGTFSVMASNASTGEPEYRPLRSTVTPAPVHSLLQDTDTKNFNFPRSIRYSHPAIFGFLAAESGLLHADVSNMTYVTDSKVFPNQELRVDTAMGGATVGLSVPK